MLDEANGHGEINLPAMTIPMSEALSIEAKGFYTNFLQILPGNMFAESGETWDKARERWQPIWDMLVQRARSICAVDIISDMIAGVRVDVITPLARGSNVNAARVIIFAHAGGFCNGQGAISEAIGLAGTGGIKVISVDYSLAPESKFPTQIEQIIAVYSALQSDYQPKEIALVGTSAGGQIMQMSVARMIMDGIQPPAALALFSAGLANVLSATGSQGDTGYYGAALEGYIFYGGIAPHPEAATAQQFFEDVDSLSPLIAPAFSPDILRQFPPTLLMGAGRDEALSVVFVSHRSLLAAGVPTELHVWEGLCHGFWLVAGLPESTDAYRTTLRFIEEHFDRSGNHVDVLR